MKNMVKLVAIFLCLSASIIPTINADIGKFDLSIVDEITNQKLTVLVPTPEKPTGPQSGYHGTLYCYSTEPIDVHYTVEYKFSWGDGTESSWSLSTGACHKWTNVGKFNVKVKARDMNSGAESAWSVPLVVYIGNHHPKAYKPQGPSEGIVGEEYCYTARGEDADGDELWFNFDWDDGTSTGWFGPYPSGQTVEACHVWDCYCNPHIQVHVKDKWDGDSSPLLEIWIDWAPLEADAGGPYSGYVSQTITLQGSATGGNLEYTYEWDLDDDGNFDDGSGKTVTNIWSSPGTYTIHLKVTDQRINPDSDTDTAQVTIENEEPNTPPNTPQTPEGAPSGTAGNPYTYSTKATDPQSDSVRYQWDWGDGTISDWSTLYPSGVQVSETYIWEEKGAYQIQVRAQDEHGLISDWSSAMEVIMPRNARISALLSDITPVPLPILKTWMKTYGASNYDEGRCVQQTNEGGYIITGYTDSYGADRGDVWLIKTNIQGKSTTTSLDNLWLERFFKRFLNTHPTIGPTLRQLMGF